VKDYTKAGWRVPWTLAIVVCLLALAGLGAGPSPASTAPAKYDFSTWHYPVPAGDWLISRGPCGGGGLFTHQCGYYEDECAYDLTPVDGSMLSVPVLAPQDGQVFFLGTRTDSGLAVLLQHPDGRISALFHLSQVVVGLDQRVTQGQVIGYAGNTGSSSKPHLHFDVQPNAVERSCLPLNGIDEMDPRLMTIRSHNLPWQELVLPNPPAGLPAWLPLTGLSAPLGTASLPQRVVLAPSARASVPIAIASSVLGTQVLEYDGQVLTPTAATSGFTLFTLALDAPAEVGDYQGSLNFRVGGPVMGTPPITFRYAVRAPVDSQAGAGLVWINPRLVSPADYSVFSRVPQLCVSEPAVVGPAPLTFRVMVSGAGQADSGWMADECWTPPPLAPGTYYWKAFVRDAQGHMNRTNDRPSIFKIH
jgi:hypothetical protein